MYGKNQNFEETSTLILSYVNDVLENAEPGDIHSELSLLSRVDKYSDIDRGYMNRSSGFTNDTKNQLSRLEILLITISVMIVAAVIYFIFLRRQEGRYDGERSSVKNEGDMQRDIRNEFDGASDNEDEFVDEDLSFEPYRDNRQSGTVLY